LVASYSKICELSTIKDKCWHSCPLTSTAWLSELQTSTCAQRCFVTIRCSLQLTDALIQLFKMSNGLSPHSLEEALAIAKSSIAEKVSIY
jgi:hypothetical protein